VSVDHHWFYAPGGMLVADAERPRSVLVADPTLGLPDHLPNVELARAAVVEFLFGDLTVDELDRELDWYVRGIQPWR
jgi:hypothetical protein